MLDWEGHMIPSNLRHTVLLDDVPDLPGTSQHIISAVESARINELLERSDPSDCHHITANNLNKADTSALYDPATLHNRLAERGEISRLVS